MASISVPWGVEPEALRVAAVQDTECQICKARGENMLKEVQKCEQHLSLEIKKESKMRARKREACHFLQGVYCILIMMDHIYFKSLLRLGAQLENRA